MITICYSKGKHTDELKVEKRKNAKASPNGRHAKRFPFWRERGNDGRRWKVESTLLEQRNAAGC